MIQKFILSISILILLQFLNCSAQEESFNNLYTYAKEFVAEMEEMGYEIVHLDFNILTVNDRKEDIRRNLDPDYEYTIAAYGDPEKIQSIQIELYESGDDDWELVKKGEMVKNVSSASALYLVPEKYNNYLITVHAKEFESNARSGRFFLVVANKTNVIEIKTYAKEDIKYSMKSGKIKRSNYTSYYSTFKIYLSSASIEHVVSSYRTLKYSLVENLTEDKNKDSFISYLVEDNYGKEYAVQIDLVNKSIIFLESTGKKNVFTGKRYYYSSDL